jgi:CysZ protein
MSMLVRRPQPLPRGLLASLAGGFRYGLEPLGLIGRAGLWPLALAAVLVKVILVAALIAAVLTWLVPEVRGLVASLDAWAAGSRALAAFVAVAGGLVWVLAVGLGVAASAVIVLMVGQAVASPFLDVLSERVETLVLGTAPVPSSAGRVVASMRMAVGDLVWTLVYWVLLNLPLFVLGLVAAPVSAGLGFVVSAVLLAQEFVGLALARRLVPYRRRFAIFRGHRAVALGFGAACMLLFAVPGLNLVLLPVATVGGTLLYCDLTSARGAATSSRGAA